MTRLVSQEEGRLLRKSQKLWDQLVQTEERAREIMQETERLKRAKDEAKALVARKHPHLFRDASADYDDDDDDLGLRSFSSAGDTHDSYLNQDLRDIKNMLNRPGRMDDGRGRGGGGAGSNGGGGVEARIERLRREVSGASNPAAAVTAAPTATMGWPADCVPVPVETFKRLLADAAAAADAATVIKSHRGHEIDRDGRRRRRVSANGRNSSGDESRLGMEGGDDTSHDVADLSSQEAEEDARTARKKLVNIGHPDDGAEIATRDRDARARQLQQPPVTPAPRYVRRKLDGADNASVPPKVTSKKLPPPPPPRAQTVDDRATVTADDISSRRSASGAENSAQVYIARSDSNPLSGSPSPERKAPEAEADEEEHFANNARHYEDAARRRSKEETSSTTPDENFVLNSEDGNQKLFSSATSEEEEEEEEEAGGNRKGSSPAVPTKPHTERVRTDKRKEERSEQPNKSFIRLGHSDTEGSSGDMRQKLYDEVVSGPETTGDDDDDGDFWG